MRTRRNPCLYTVNLASTRHYLSIICRLNNTFYYLLFRCVKVFNYLLPLWLLFVGILAQNNEWQAIIFEKSSAWAIMRSIVVLVLCTYKNILVVLNLWNPGRSPGVTWPSGSAWDWYDYEEKPWGFDIPTLYLIKFTMCTEYSFCVNRAEPRSTSGLQAAPEIGTRKKPRGFGISEL